MPPYTVVITSCGRFDLLNQTLDSLIDKLHPRPESILIVEDSADPAVHEVASQFPGVRVLLNTRQIGQLASIDRAYKEVETEYVFHCEDDWDFFRDGFIEPSFALLEAFPDISMVGLRSRDELNPLTRNAETEYAEKDAIPFFRLKAEWHPEMFGYSFNPGLRRIVDYRRIAPLAQFADERAISYCFKRLGFTIAYLETAAVTHAGAGRHLDDPTQAVRAKRLTDKLVASSKKRLHRLRRRWLPQWDPTERTVLQILNHDSLRANAGG